MKRQRRKIATIDGDRRADDHAEDAEVVEAVDRRSIEVGESAFFDAESAGTGRKL